MATINSVLKLQDKMSKQLENIQKALNSTDKACKNVSISVENMDRKMSSSKKSLTEINQGLELVSKGFGLLKSAMNLSDTYSQTSARLGMITDDVQGLQDKIYQSAQRSRVSYQSVADIVAKLGNQAGEAFNNSADEVLAFSELLNKTFVTSGLDDTAIASTMYNLTQSLSSGKLLGQDYRIIKQNAPQILRYLREFYGDISQAELDAMVTAGQVSGKALKQSLFKASDEINAKFSKMPVTFGQAWTKFQNTMQKILQPLAKILMNVSEWLDGIFTFLADHEYILYIIMGAIAALAVEYTILQVKAWAAKVAQDGLNSSMWACPATWVILAIAALIAVLIWLWNTNDDVADAMIWAWDRISLGLEHAGMNITLTWEMIKAAGYWLAGSMQKIGAIFLSVWYGLRTGVELIVLGIIGIFETLVNSFIDGIGAMVDVVNVIPGVNIDKPERVTWGADYAAKVQEDISQGMGDVQNLLRESDQNFAIADSMSSNAWANYVKEAQEAQAQLDELDRTRPERVQNRQRLDAKNIIDGIKDGLGFDDTLDNVIGTDGTGGKAIKTTTNDDLLSDDDIKLLLDVATRDYKLNYQQITPNITLTFGDIRETADVDDILDRVADKLEEIYDANLEVSST